MTQRIVRACLDRAWVWGGLVVYPWAGQERCFRVASMTYFKGRTVARVERKSRSTGSVDTNRRISRHLTVPSILAAWLSAQGCGFLPPLQFGFDGDGGSQPTTGVEDGTQTDAGSGPGPLAFPFDSATNEAFYLASLYNGPPDDDYVPPAEEVAVLATQARIDEVSSGTGTYADDYTQISSTITADGTHDVSVIDFGSSASNITEHPNGDVEARYDIDSEGVSHHVVTTITADNKTTVTESFDDDHDGQIDHETVVITDRATLMRHYSYITYGPSGNILSSEQADGDGMSQ